MNKWIIRMNTCLTNPTYSTQYMTIDVTVFGGNNISFQICELDDKLLHQQPRHNSFVKNINRRRTRKITDKPKIINLIVQHGFIENLYQILSSNYCNVLNDDGKTEQNDDLYDKAIYYDIFYFEIDEIDNQLVFKPYGMDVINNKHIQELMKEIADLLQTEIDSMEKIEHQGKQFSPFAHGLYISFYSE